ncbi:EamA family transporter [Sphingomonas sp.]|uniref:EamA family transporter n=1 Tax=Sphingomonas sp. TaxID=28214 RepID=UPI003CC660B9
MTAFAIPAAMMVASGSIHAVVNAIVKGGRSSAADPLHARMVARGSTDGASAVVLLPAAAFVAWPHGAEHWLLASAAVHLVYLYAMIRTYALADLSAAYPVMRGSAPLLTAAISIGLFGERIATTASAGIALIGAAILTLVLGRHLDARALGWALLTGASTALYTIADARGVRAAPSPASYIVWDFVLIGSISVAMFASLTRGRLFRDLRAQWRPGAAAGVLSVATYGVALWAYALGPTAPLAALRETGMVTALVIATLFLREAVTGRRAAAVGGILAGAALILAG